MDECLISDRKEWVLHYARVHRDLLCLTATHTEYKNNKMMEMRKVDALVEAAKRDGTARQGLGVKRTRQEESYEWAQPKLVAKKMKTEKTTRLV